jgi:hypothetical protein
MTSASLSLSGASASLFLLLLLSLPHAIPPAGAQGLPADITEPVECRDQVLVVGHSIRIRSGGSLVLSGCTLAMDSPAYQNKWLGALNEGLHIQVDAGGRLELRATDARPAGIQPHDARYGYRATVEGLLVSEGTPDRRNLISGLEGFMSKQMMGAGLEVRGPGRAYLNYTDFTSFFGPGVHATVGGQAHLREVTARKASGAFAATNGTLEIDGADINVGTEGIRVTRSRLVLANATIGAIDAAVYAVSSQVEVRDSLLQATNSAVVLEGSQARLRDCRLGFSKFGVVALEAPARSSITVESCDVAAFAAGSDAVGVAGVNADARVAGSRFGNATRGAVSVSGGALEVVGSTFSNASKADLYATDPTRLVLEGNRFTAGLEKPVRYVERVRVHVRDGDGGPAQGAQVRLGNQTVHTDANGTAKVNWEPGLDEAMRPLSAPARLEVRLDGEVREREVAPGERDVTVAFGAQDGARQSPAPGIAWLAGLLAAMAAVAAGGRRRRA